MSHKHAIASSTPPTSPARALASHVRHASIVVTRSRSARRPFIYTLLVTSVIVVLLLCESSIQVIDQVRMRKRNVQSDPEAPPVTQLHIVDNTLDSDSVETNTIDLVPLEHALAAENKGDVDSETAALAQPRPDTGTKQHRFEVIRKHPQFPSSVGGLSPCKRTLLYQMAGLHGFGSEVLVLARIAVLADLFDYSLVIDSSHWNYGNWEHLFTPPKLECLPPAAHVKRPRVKFGRGTSASDEAALRSSWAHFDHVIWSRRDLEGLDRALLGLFASPTELQVLHQRDLYELRKGHIRATELVPHVFFDHFNLLSQQVNLLWRPSRHCLKLAHAARAHFKTDLSEMSANHQNTDDVMERDHLVIGMHVRLGDKYLELNKIGPQVLAENDEVGNGADSKLRRRSLYPGLSNTTINYYFDAAERILGRIIASNLTFAPGEPVLLIASDDPDAAGLIASHRRAKKFKIVDVNTLKDATASDANGQTVPRALVGSGGFAETSFNRLKLASRSAMAQGFVTDITLLDQLSQGLVMSASSNVGRLLALLSGEHKVAFGLVESIDTRWFPTSQFS